MTGAGILNFLQPPHRACYAPSRSGVTCTLLDSIQAALPMWHVPPELWAKTACQGCLQGCISPCFSSHAASADAVSAELPLPKSRFSLMLCPM